MKALDLLKDLSQRPLVACDLFWSDLSPSRLNTHPGGHANSIAWLIWHAAREIDVQVSDVGNYQQVWTAEGFDHRFDLGPQFDASNLGFGHSEEEARRVVVAETEAGKALLRDHLGAVINRATQYLETLNDKDIQHVIDPHWDPPVTLGVRLISVFDDALQHVGQAAYIAGMRQ